MEAEPAAGLPFAVAARERGAAAFKARLAELRDEEVLRVARGIAGLPFPPGFAATGYHRANMQAVIAEMQKRGLGAPVREEGSYDNEEEGENGS